MAPAGGGLTKGLYRQRKKRAAGAAKPAAGKRSKNAAKLQLCGPTDGGGGGGYGTEEEELRRFDMDMAYGPCIGVTRLRRWERAAAMGLRPPPHLRDIILRRHHEDDPGNNGGGGRGGGNGGVSLQCLWAGKV
ncbi:hypothetical protein ACP4OV_005335 [Aristida adscensionis]